MKSKLIKVIIAGVVVIGISFGGYYGYNAYTTPKTAAAAAMQYYSVNVRKMNLQETIQGTGAAYTASTKDVSPENNGIIKNLSVKVGDTVTAGQKLFTADSDDLRRSVTSAQNNLTKAKLALSTDESAAKVDDNKVAMDQLSVNDAQSQLNSAYENLNNTTVTAPIGGVVTVVNNTNGDSVQAGKSVLTIMDMSSMKVKVSVDELDIEKVKVGQKATVKFDAIEGKTYDGTVETIAPTGTSSNNVTTYDVVVNITNPAGIKPGMNANVTIAVQSKDNALVIPAEALIENNGRKFVRVESTDNADGQNSGTNTTSRPKMTEIKTGLETVNYIEVTEGLTEGEKVLVQLPKTSTTNNNNNKNGFGGGFGGMNGGFGGYGGNMGGTRNQGGGRNSTKTN